MHFYSMPLNDILDMPIYTFWELSKNVSRIMAEEDMRMCAIVASALGGAKDLIRDLKKERGDVVVFDETGSGGFDKDSFKRLKIIMGG